MVKTCWAIFVAGIVAASHAAIHQTFEEKQESASLVYQRITSASGRLEQPPELRLRRNGEPQPPAIAWYDPRRKLIVVEERVFDLCGQIGQGMRDNALAVILGHELSHFYRQHDWGGDFGNDPENQPILGVRNAEADADYYGGFFSYLAGYETLAVGTLIYEAIYRSYALDETKLKAYPTLALRQEILNSAVQRVRELIPLFEIGVLLLMVDECRYAARCFDEIATEFPSREILNNAGTARAYEAISLFQASGIAREYPWARFSYPLMSDAKSRLGIRVLGTESAEDRRRILLLEDALKLFLRSQSADKEYAPALINIACVHQLQGQQDHALPYARDAVAAAIKSGDEHLLANALVMRGIIYASIAESPGGTGQYRSLAANDFQAAVTLKNELGRVNLYAMEAGPENFKSPWRGSEKVSDMETIAGLSPEDGLSGDPPPTKRLLPFKNEADRELIIRVRDAGHGRAARASRKGGGASYSFLTTVPGYTGQTQQGIKLGSTLAEVVACYGSPARILQWRQSISYVYRETAIIFTMQYRDQSEPRVIAWTLYWSGIES